MTITTRAGKGSALTHNELDGNFTDIDARLKLADLSRSGMADYNDLATATVPLSYTGTDLHITNDGAGAFTKLDKLPAGITVPFIVGTGLFDFAGMADGDEVEVRLDLEVTTTAVNQEWECAMELGAVGSKYEIQFGDDSKKSTGTYKFIRDQRFYMDSGFTLNNGGRILFRSDANATIKVNGFYMRYTLRGGV